MKEEKWTIEFRGENEAYIVLPEERTELTIFRGNKVNKIFL